jgi:hypothetical protein
VLGLTSLITLPHRLAGGLLRALGRAPGAARRWWADQNQYEQVVPEHIRRLAKERGIPKPMRYVP